MGEMTEYSEETVERAAAIRLLLMDVDGVWSDGSLFYLPGHDDEIVEFKFSNAQDGMALRWFHGAGFASGLISGRDAPGITYRARMLGVTYIYQGHLDKIEPFKEICSDAGVDDHQVAYVGDDLPDVPLIRRVGLGVSGANGRREVKASADLVTEREGGSGAIREVIELILKAQGIWPQILDRYGLENA